MKRSLQILMLSFLMLSCAHKENSPFYIKSGLIYSSKTNQLYSGLLKGKTNQNYVEYDVKNGVKNGSFKLFTLQGKLIVKGQIEQNRNIGKWEYFYQGGELESTGFFTDDKPSGIWCWFYQKGKLKEAGKFIKGQRDSVWVVYDEQGQILQQKRFKDGIEIPM
jgi:antitoxin component YwqK of YwqJK toxin-antitoxin module